jgi:hypothetical protein
VAIDRLEDLNDTMIKVLGISYQHSRQLETMRRELGQTHVCGNLHFVPKIESSRNKISERRPSMTSHQAMASQPDPSPQQIENMRGRVEATHNLCSMLLGEGMSYPQKKIDHQQFLTSKRQTPPSVPGSPRATLSTTLMVCMIVLWPVLVMGHPVVTPPTPTMSYTPNHMGPTAEHAGIPFQPGDPRLGSYLHHEENLTLSYREGLHQKLKSVHRPISWQYCGNGRSGYPVQIPQTPLCELPGVGQERSSLDTFHVQLWVPRTKPLLFDAYKCVSIITTICTYTSIVNGKGILRHTNTERFPPPEECERVFKTRRFGRRRLKKLSYRLWSTHTPLVPLYKWCCTAICKSIENFNIERGTIGTVDGYDLQSDLGMMHHNCTIRDQRCFDHMGGYVQWEVKKMPPICPFEEAGTFGAQRVDHFITVPSIQEAYTLTTEYAPPCTNQLISVPEYPRTRLSQQGVGIRILGQTAAVKYMHYVRKVLIPAYLKEHLEEEEHNKSYAIQNAQAFALQYLEAWTVKGFELIWKDLCARKQSEIMEIRMEIRREPTTGARLLLKREDLHAYVAGEVLFITRCQPMRPDVIYWNYTFHGECYMDVPVWAGHLFFGSPLTGDLFTFSPKVPCSTVRQGVYFENGHYRTQDGNVSVSVIPLHMTNKKGWKSFSFSAPALVHDQSDSLKLSFTMLQEYVTRFHSLTRTVAKLVNYTASTTFDPQAVRQAFSGTAQALGTVIISAGKAIGSMFVGYAEGITKLVSGLLGDTLQIVINCLVIALMGLVILAFGYWLYLQLQKRHPGCLTRIGEWKRQRQGKPPTTPSSKLSAINSLLPTEENPTRETSKSYLYETTSKQTRSTRERTKKDHNKKGSVHSLSHSEYVSLPKQLSHNKSTKYQKPDTRLSTRLRSLLKPRNRSPLVVTFHNKNEHQAARAEIHTPIKNKKTSVLTPSNTHLHRPVILSDPNELVLQPTAKHEQKDLHSTKYQQDDRRSFHPQAETAVVFKSRPYTAEVPLQLHRHPPTVEEPRVHYEKKQRSYASEVPGRHYEKEVNARTISKTVPKVRYSVDESKVHIAKFIGSIGSTSTPMGYLTIKIENILVKVLCDTGASISIIDWAFVIRNNLGPIKDTEIEAKSASGHLLDVMGTIEPIITVGKKIFKAIMTVVKDAGQTLIGGDILQQCGTWTFDYPNRRLFSDDAGVLVSLTPYGVRAVMACLPPTVIVADETWEIPPGTQCLFHGLVSTPFSAKEGYFEPRAKLPYMRRVSLQNTVVPVYRIEEVLRIPVVAANLTFETAKIYKGTILGTLEKMGKIPMNKLPQVINQIQSAPPSLTIDDVWKQINIKNPALTDEDLLVVKKFIKKYIEKGLFAISDFDLGHCGLIQHRIHTGNHPPIKQRPYPVPIPMRPEIDEQVDKMIQQGIITPSISPWSSPIVLVRKKDSTYRFCIDYRKLNACTKKDTFPIPNIQLSLATIGKADFFSSIDLQSGYHQVELHPDSKEKTAFATHSGLFEFQRLPFGLTNAPPTFQRLLDCILCSVINECAIVYIDDVLVFSNNGLKGHVEKLERICDKFLEANLKLKPSKCEFFKQQVTFLGHVISKKGVATDPKTVEAAEQLQEPRDADEVRKVLGLLQYYRNFIPGFSQIAAPLTELLKGHCTNKRLPKALEQPPPFIWTDDCRKAFLDLKNRLITSPILAFPDFTKEFILYCDGSKLGIGSILSQKGDDGKIRPICFASKKLNKAQINYPITEIETWSVVWSLNHFRPYLMFQPVTVYVDNQVTSFFMNKKEPIGRMARWLLTFNDYKVTLKHRSGKANGNADTLSRFPFEEAAPEGEEENVLTITPQQIHAVSAIWTRSKARACEIPEDPVDPYTLEAPPPFGWLQNQPIPPKPLEKLEDPLPKPEVEIIIEPATPLLSVPIMKDGGSQTIPVTMLPGTYRNRVNEPTPVWRKKHEGLTLLDPFHLVKEEGGEIDDNIRMEGDIQPHQQEDVDWTLQPEDPPFLKPLQELRDQQFLDLTLQHLIRHLKGDPSFNPGVAENIRLQHIAPDYKLIHGILHTTATRAEKIFPSTRAFPDHRELVVIPAGMQQALMKYYHEQTGHFGNYKTYALITRKFYWKNCRSQTFRYCRECLVCQSKKDPPFRTVTPIRPWKIPRRPFQHLSIDVMGPLPMSEDGNRFVIVIMDTLTRYCIAVATETITAEKTAQVIFEYVVCQFGSFEMLTSDNGSNFTSEVTKLLSVILGYERRFTPPYHPQSNGIVEKQNKTIGKMLAMHCNERQTDWDKSLKWLIFCYNATTQISLGFSPYYLLYARDPLFPIDYTHRLPNPNYLARNYSDYVEEIGVTLVDVHRAAKEALEQKQQLNIYFKQDKYREPYQFEIGQLILIWNPYVPKGQTAKLKCSWFGPVRIINILDHGSIQIAKPGGKLKRIPIIHPGYCKPFRGSHTPDLQTADGVDIGEEIAQWEVDMSKPPPDHPIAMRETGEIENTLFQRYNLRPRQKGQVVAAIEEVPLE